MNQNRILATVLVLVFLSAGAGVGAVSAEDAENTSSTEEVDENVTVLENTVGLEFDKVLGDAGLDSTDSVAQTDDGGFVLAGRKSSGVGSDTDAWLIKTDENGVTEFERTFGGDDFDSARSVIQASDGGFALAGGTNSFGSGDGDAWLIKTDENGNEEFRRTFDAGRSGLASSVIQTSDGGFALGGRTELGPPGIDSQSDAWLIETDENGNLETSETFGGSEDDEANTVMQTPDGGFALGGNTGSFSPGGVWLLRTDSNGNERWNETYGGSGLDGSAVQTIDGGFALAGSVTEPGSDSDIDAWLVKTNSSGSEEWTESFGESGSFDVAKSVEQTRFGGFALGGNTESFGAEGTDFWLTRTELDGTEVWNNTYGGSGFESAEEVIQTEDGSFALVGRTNSFGAENNDGWFVKTRFCVDTTGDGDRDSDDDSLCDNWESEGVDVDADGDSEFDLHQAPYNADPTHKDIFVEIDYMRQGPGEPARGHQPLQGALQNVTGAFEDAPVPNPDGNQGIDLHLRVDSGGNNLPESQALNHRRILNYTGNGPAADFDTVKNNNFGAPGDDNKTRLGRRLTHRYAIFAHQVQNDSTSGKAEDILGNDFIVSLGGPGWPNSVGSVTQQQGTLMHELGHTLNLRHGGFNNRNCKPNYLSVMSYSLQFPRFVPDRPLDYSSQNIPTLNESNLNENVGVQGPAGRQTVYDSGVDNFSLEIGPASGPIDWNVDGDTNDSSVSRDINAVGAVGCEVDGETVLEGHDDWDNLVYNFRGTPAFADGVHPTPPGTEELTFEDVFGDSTTPGLVVEANVSSVEVGTQTGLRANVTTADDGAPVQDATVNVTGVGVDVPDMTTDANGTAVFTVTPDETGDVTVTAAKNGFSSDQTTVQAIDGDSDLFTEPLPGFNNPPTNTGELDPTLYEDVDGDGDGTDPTQAVNLWTQLVLNPQDFDDLTQQQIDALDWNGDGQLTPADAVQLWTEQVLAG